MKLKLNLLLVPACLLGACALEPKRVEPPVTRVIVKPALPSEADQLLVYAMRLRQLDARELAVEREQTRNTFSIDKSDFNRVRLAMLLVPSLTAQVRVPTNPTQGASDDAELMLLLEPLVRDAQGTALGAPAADTSTTRDELRALALLIHSMAQERKKLRDQWRETQARLTTIRRDDSKDVEARALRARIDELERRLAALKSIDRSVNRRSEAQRADSPRTEPIK